MDHVGILLILLTGWGGKPTGSVTGRNINSMDKESIQALKISLGGHNMEAKKKNTLVMSQRLPMIT